MDVPDITISECPKMQSLPFPIPSSLLILKYNINSEKCPHQKCTPQWIFSNEHKCVTSF